MRKRQARGESGVALLVTILMLAIMGVMGLASMDTVMRDRQVAGFQKRSQTSLYASEAGVSMALALIRADVQALASGGEGALASYDPSGESPPRFPVPTGPLAIGSDFPSPGSPSFSLDPNASDPANPLAAPRAIRYLGRGDTCPGWVMSEETGGTAWNEALWDIRVQGMSPGGGSVSIQSTGANCHPFSN